MRLQAFEDFNGCVLSFYFCRTVPSGCVHTQLVREAKEQKLHLALPPRVDIPTWIADLLSDCWILSVEIRRILQPPDEHICMEMLQGLVTELLRLIDVLHGELVSEFRTASEAGAGADGVAVSPSERLIELSKAYTEQLAAVRDLYTRSAQRAAQWTYFLGMVVGTLALVFFTAAVFGVLIWLGWVRTFEDEVELNLLVMVFVAGGVGAIVSVMQRVAAGELTLQYPAGRTALRLAGGFRPLVGAVFAGVISLLLIAGLLPITVPAATDGYRMFAFFGVVAFLSGFSERWAQDMLAVGQAGFGTSSKT